MKLLAARALYWLKGLFENPAELFNALGVESDDRILEVGCATGYHTLPLARIASEGRVYAVDVWEEGLAHLERRAAPFDNVDVMRRSAGDVEWPDASLDKVVCFDTLHELGEPGEALKQWARLLKQDGELLYRDPIIPPERIGPLSEGRFRHSESVRGVDVFVQRAPTASRGS